MQQFPRVFITQKGEKHAKTGHPWVFEGEVVKILSPESHDEFSPTDGSLVNVFSKSEEKPKFIGTGFYNSKSKIRVRMISTCANDKFDESFYRRRIKYAIDYRRTVMGSDFSSCRLIFGEADQFPGMTVDKFEDVLVCQFCSLGVDLIKDMLIGILLDELHKIGVEIHTVYERNDVNLREKEGLTEYKDFFNCPPTDTDGHVRITENGIIYDVDYINGQKTGFFLDQKYNRQAAARLAEGKTVLDCFTHTGAFALNCAKTAKSVTAVDISETAIAQAKHNAALNGLENRINFVCEDVFELLTRLVEEKTHPYDYIILDPPAFTKSSSTVKDAYRGYKDINYRAMRALPRGGYLATCSCSHFMPGDLFCKMLNEAAHDAGVTLRQIESRTQSPDHPILWNVSETDYLKFFLFQVV